MGNLRMIREMRKCNALCPMCKSSGQIPNLAGRFFLIENDMCQCNGCNTIFDKKLFYGHYDVERDLIVTPTIATFTLIDQNSLIEQDSIINQTTNQTIDQMTDTIPTVNVMIEKDILYDTIIAEAYSISKNN
jgi:hypothetical protein